MLPIPTRRLQLRCGCRILDFGGARFEVLDLFWTCCKFLQLRSNEDVGDESRLLVVQDLTFSVFLGFAANLASSAPIETKVPHMGFAHFCTSGMRCDVVVLQLSPAEPQ